MLIRLFRFVSFRFSFRFLSLRRARCPRRHLPEVAKETADLAEQHSRHMLLAWSFRATQVVFFDDRAYVLVLVKNNGLRIRQHRCNKGPVVEGPFLRTSDCLLYLCSFVCFMCLIALLFMFHLLGGRGSSFGPARATAREGCAPLIRQPRRAHSLRAWAGARETTNFLFALRGRMGRSLGCRGFGFDNYNG